MMNPSLNNQYTLIIFVQVHSEIAEYNEDLEFPPAALPIYSLLERHQFDSCPTYWSPAAVEEEVRKSCRF